MVFLDQVSDCQLLMVLIRQPVLLRLTFSIHCSVPPTVTCFASCAWNFWHHTSFHFLHYLFQVE